MNQSCDFVTQLVASSISPNGKMQSDTSSFGSSRSIKNLRRSNSTTQVNQQGNDSR